MVKLSKKNQYHATPAESEIQGNCFSLEKMQVSNNMAPLTSSQGDIIFMEKYNNAKKQNQAVMKISDGYVSEKMQKRVEKCGDWLEFIADFDVKKKKLMAANFCKWRFCPMCAMRKSVKDAMKIGTMMSYISDKHRKAFMFATFTAPNVPAEQLPDEITRFNKAFKNMVKRSEVEGMNEGYIRKLEITYNKKRKDYHPHFHVIFAVKPGYFSGGRYIKQSRWLELWREAMDDYTITQVDVRRMRPRSDSKELAKGFDAREIAKYAAKDVDFTKNVEVFEVFHNALKGRQVLTYNGLFKIANDKFKKDELEEYIPTDNTAYYWKLFYKWSDGNYNEKNKKALDEVEKMFLAKRGIDTELCD